MIQTGLKHCVFGGKRSICSCQCFQQLDMVTSIFLNIFVQDCSFCPRLVQNVPEFRYEILKANFCLILFAYNLMIEYFKRNWKNYSRKFFRSKLGPGIQAVETDNLFKSF